MLEERYTRTCHGIGKGASSMLFPVYPFHIHVCEKGKVKISIMFVYMDLNMCTVLVTLHVYLRRCIIIF